MVALTPLDLAVVAGYFTAVIALGFWVGRGRRDATDYFLAGRGLPWALVGLSFYASNMSGASFVGLMGAAYEHGMVVFNYEWTAALVLVVFADGFLATTPLPMYAFLLGSHLMMVVEAFLIHRYSDFPVGAVAVAVAWYGLNDAVDYFVPVVGTPHHTLLPGQRIVDGTITHLSPTHEIAAACAVALTLTATFLTLATRVKKLESGRVR
jgi:hypothetical protein